ncbi:hypothetical protein PENNAL_c0010G09713 [Penicillium nalgiovense]|uniref:Uncharacterized protein n=1 Tax=Penicillium nalgiovense TaxID=60175 RepID=A0A1V6YUU4_PENNA|nr:hypothetical protein PENNAL_c0010G09713 [Penicillium nalgiovense]
MPLHIRDIDTPESPSWGFPPSPHSMFTSSQNGKHPIPTKTQSSETPSERRSRLIRRFIQLGSREREPYNCRSPPQPTDAQTAKIFHPARPEAFRRTPNSLVP